MTDIGNILFNKKNIFVFFDEVYLFGSSLNNTQYPNDIDLLLVYKIYSERIQYEKENVILLLEKLLRIPIDITILSEKELKPTNFLEKLKTPYKKIK